MFPKIIMVPPSPKVTIVVEPEGGPVLSITTIAVETQSTDQASAGPSSMVPAARVARVSILVPPHASITFDVGMAKRLLEFILQPQDRRERVSHSLGDTITRIFS